MASRSSTNASTRRSIGALVALAVFGTATPAFAGPEEEELLKRGVALRREGKDAEALEIFQRVVTQAPSARARAQLALAEQSLALWLAAERDLSLALAEPNDPWVAQNKDALERAARVIAGKLAWVKVTSNVAKPQVLANGTPATPSPDGRVRVVAGQVTIEVRADDHAPAQKVISVAPETTAAVGLELVPKPKTAAPIERPAPRPVPPPNREPPSSAQRTVGYSLMGVGVVGLGVGAFFGVTAMNKKTERDDACVGGCTQAGVDADRAGRTSGLVSTICVGVGAVGLATGIYLVLSTPSQSRGGVALRPGLGAVTLDATF